MVHPSKLRCTMSFYALRLFKWCILNQNKYFYCFFYCFTAAPYWSTPHSKWATRHPEKQMAPSPPTAVSRILLTKFIIYREKKTPRNFHKQKSFSSGPNSGCQGGCVYLSTVPLYLYRKTPRKFQFGKKSAKVYHSLYSSIEQLKVALWTYMFLKFGINND